MLIALPEILDLSQRGDGQQEHLLAHELIIDEFFLMVSRDFVELTGTLGKFPKRDTLGACELNRRHR